MFLQPGEGSNQPRHFGPGDPNPSASDEGLIDFGPLFGQELVRLLKYEGLMTEIVFWQDHLDLESPTI